MDEGEAAAAAGGDGALDALGVHLGYLQVSPAEAEPATADGVEDAAPGAGDAEDALEDDGFDEDDGGGSEAEEEAEAAEVAGGAAAPPADQRATLQAARATVRRAWLQRALGAGARAGSEAARAARR